MSDSGNIDKIVGQLKDVAELQAYADAQYATIVKQNKKINELQDKVTSLEAIVGANGAVNPNVIQFPSLVISPEEEICLKQLELLRQTSNQLSLTLEEARKVEIYSKILIGIRSNVKDVDAKYKNLSTEQLLKLTLEPTNESK